MCFGRVRADPWDVCGDPTSPWGKPGDLDRMKQLFGNLTAWSQAHGGIPLFIGESGCERAQSTRLAWYRDFFSLCSGGGGQPAQAGCLVWDRRARRRCRKCDRLAVRCRRPWARTGRPGAAAAARSHCCPRVRMGLQVAEVAYFSAAFKPPAIPTAWLLLPLSGLAEPLLALAALTWRISQAELLKHGCKVLKGNGRAISARRIGSLCCRRIISLP